MIANKPVIAQEYNHLEKQSLESIDSVSNEIKSQQANKSKFSVSAKDLLAQNDLTRVTGVELNQTNDGLQIILKTAGGQLVPLILPEGNNLVIDILDATLALSEGNEFTENNPAPGIDRIALTPVDATSIRLTITGETQAPDAEVVPSRQNLTSVSENSPIKALA